MNSTVERWYAVDESFDEASGNAAVGVLRATADCTLVVNKAMANLRELIVGIKGDALGTRVLKTLDRGYFHASEDGRVAHEVFAASIANLRQWKIWIPSMAQSSQIRQEELFRALCTAMWQDISTSSSGCLIQIEGGPIAADQNSADDLIRAVKERYEGEVNRKRRERPRKGEHPLFRQGLAAPLHSPCWEAAIGTKDTPAIQVADFLLWSARRIQHEKETGRHVEQIGRRSHPPLEFGPVQFETWEARR